MTEKGPSSNYCRELDTRTVRIWSKKRAAWWRWYSSGYTEDEAKAGLYTGEEAEAIIEGTHGENEIREVGAPAGKSKQLKRYLSRIVQLEQELYDARESVLTSAGVLDKANTKLVKLEEELEDARRIIKELRAEKGVAHE